MIVLSILFYLSNESTFDLEDHPGLIEVRVRATIRNSSSTSINWNEDGDQTIYLSGFFLTQDVLDTDVYTNTTTNGVRVISKDLNFGIGGNC